MSYLIHNLDGLRFHKLTVIGRSANFELRRQGYWECKCDCGKIRQIISNSLRNGVVKSCGAPSCKITSRYRDLTGQRFGRLVAKSFFSKKKTRFWFCICDCGNENIVRTANLTSGQVRSCGCLARDVASQNAKQKRLPKGVPARNAVVQGYQKSAAKSGREWNLSDEQLEVLFKGNCRKTNSGDSFIYNGIDRKNNEIGYIANNVVSCCRECNMAKSGRSYDEFITWIQRLAKHYNTSILD
jgi:hypothetical protein